MPVTVIDLFETIKIAREYGDLMPARSRLRHHVGDLFLRRPPVCQTGQVVGHRKKLQLFLDRFQFKLLLDQLKFRFAQVGDVKPHAKGGAIWQLCPQAAQVAALIILPFFDLGARDMVAQFGVDKSLATVCGMGVKLLIHAQPQQLFQRGARTNPIAKRMKMGFVGRIADDDPVISVENDQSGGHGVERLV